MVIALLLAAGKAERFQGRDKLRELLMGKPILWHSLKMLEDHPHIEKIVLVISHHNKRFAEKLIREGKFSKVTKIVFGGETRQESVSQALHSFSKKKNPEYLIVHNAANPLSTPEEISACLETLEKEPEITGVAVGRSLTSSIKKIDKSSSLPPHGGAGSLELVEQTIPRETLFAMETPQAVRFEMFYRAHVQAQKEGFIATDDIGLLEWYGYKTAILPASHHNRKLTTPEDLSYMKTVLGDIPQDFRVGLARDAHTFSHKNGLVLAGQTFTSFPQLKANSDGDVLIHAISSALSQALGYGSLGSFATPLFEKGVKNSSAYLLHTLKKTKRNGYSLVHLGIHLEGESPRFDSIIPLLRKNLSRLTRLSESSIGITASSGNSTSPFFKRGIAASCVVLLKKYDQTKIRSKS